jgi:hypothetical protein
MIVLLAGTWLKYQNKPVMGYTTFYRDSDSNKKGNPFFLENSNDSS